MQNYVNVVVKEDDSVQRKLQKTADKLHSKYNKKRKINEKYLLKKKTGWRRVVSIISNVILTILCVFCCMLVVSSILFRINKLTPSFAGYSFMRISSGSMVKSGFNIGDNIVVKSVDVDTLQVGDFIAFYVYQPDYSRFDDVNAKVITVEQTEHKSGLTLSKFFGIPNDTIKSAAKANSRLVFHSIVTVYEDENGERWFKTRGTSNPANDYYEVSERVIVGLHDDSGFANLVSWGLKALTNNMTIIFLLAIPVAFLGFSLVMDALKKVQLAKLELDCVEEKRFITDEICVKNDVGFNMDKKTKYKILAQAPPHKREEYVALLWRDGSAPASIRKYVIRKNFMLKPNEHMLEVNRKCEQMFKDGENPIKIAKYYSAEKEKVANDQKRYKEMFKKMRKQYAENKNEEKVRMEDAVVTKHKKTTKKVSEETKEVDTTTTSEHNNNESKVVSAKTPNKNKNSKKITKTTETVKKDKK